MEDMPEELLKHYQNKFESQELEGLEIGSNLHRILENR
jgi:hypothetical protein